jgi:TolA-binding protein
MRFTYKKGKLIAAMTLICLLASTTTQAQLSNEELLERLDAMQQQIDELKQQLAQTQNQAEETDAKVEAVADVVESEPQLVAETRKTTIGGYGELHYNNLSANDPSRDLEEIDFHRFVLFFGHEFNDKTRFYSEVELEHAYVADSGGDTPGEVTGDAMGTVEQLDPKVEVPAAQYP